MAKTDVWMPLYVSDYLADTTFLTTEQHGAYLLLLMSAWMSDGVLVDSDYRFASICRCTSDHWKSNLRPIMSEFFSISEGKWAHNRVIKEKNKAVNLSEIRAVAGSIGGSKKQANKVANALQKATPSQSPSPSQSQSPSESPSQSPPQEEETHSAIALSSPTAPVFVLPEWIDQELWKEWMKVRKQKKAVNSVRAMEALVERVFKCTQAGFSADMAIKTAIERSWKSVDPEWLKNSNSSGKADPYTAFIEGTSHAGK